MDRRRFLSTTMLSGLGMLALVRSSGASQCQALSLGQCGSDHAAQVATMMQTLEAEGITGEARMDVLRAITCSGCGRPLID